MPEPVVETKLLLPRPRPRSVDRPRLVGLLPRSAETRLTLVSAPAGFGKTTLIASWVHGGTGTRRTAWVSLDERDRDAATFWTYVLLAINRAVPGVATAALDQVRTGRVPLETILAGLLNELSVLPEDLVVVLDDYHLADGPGIHTGMTFLVDHLPPQLHLVISTRADPALPLPRLRARGELLEIRAPDLRFTANEAGAYLRGVHGLQLAAADVATLEAKTEGWAAALQLAALSLRGRSTPSDFIAGFAGADRFVVDYLADEVLDRQPPDVRRFLLDTCVLDRMTGALCDAVTGGDDGRRMLAELERANLFVVALDDQRRWYRYHHLFADVLQAHLLDERPDDVPALHRRAAAWLDRHGETERAVSHALASGDVERAADLVELAIPSLRRHRREAVLRRWADELPPQVVARRPVLAVGFVHAFTSSNQFDGVEERLLDVERLMAGPAEDHVVANRAEYARLPGAISTYRAALDLVAGDLPGTIRHAERAMGQADPADLLTRASAAALTGIASWSAGDLAGAYRGYTAAADGLARIGHIADVLGCTITLVDIEITQGRLAEAQTRIERALRLAERGRSQPDRLRGTADMHVALARIAWERADLVASARYLDRAEALGEAAGLPQNAYRWRVEMARLREAAGDLDGAVNLLEEAQRLYVGDFAPEVRPVAADLARLVAARGDVVDALARLQALGVAADDDLTYRREYEHLTLARALLAVPAGDGDPARLSEATGLLHRLLAAAQAGGRTRTVLEVLILLARAHDAAHERTHALALLDQAATVAEPGCFLGVFSLERGHVRGLVNDLLARQPGRPFVRRIRDAVRALPPRTLPDAASRTAGSGPDAMGAGTAPSPPLDPLSDRELDVLRYLCTELDGPAIARQLSVSLSTVRTHTQHIYAKLGVNSRRAAVRRAHQLDLLTAAPGRR